MFFSALALATAISAPQEPRPQIMVLGVFHFDNPGLDVLNPSVPDLSGERRQKEIIAIVDSLEKWKPTKICLESPYGSQTTPNNYSAYVAGTRELLIGERDQIGFRLAKRLGHSTVYGIDYRVPMDFDTTMAYAQEHNQMEKLNSLFAEAQLELDKWFGEEAVKGHTVADILEFFNSQEADDFSHSMYLEMAQIGGGEDYPGADMVSGWLDRNLKIAINTRRIMDKPDERVLIIIGMGHAMLLRDYFRQMRDVDEVSPLPFLKDI